MTTATTVTADEAFDVYGFDIAGDRAHVIPIRDTYACVSASGDGGEWRCDVPAADGCEVWYFVAPDEQEAIDRAHSALASVNAADAIAAGGVLADLADLLLLAGFVRC